MSKQLLLIFTVFQFSTLLLGHANYTGYSGAPGTLGRCASYCHGSTGGTIIVQGFPTTYVPGQNYTIKIKHTAGSKISNLNASVRVGSGSTTAGIITAGLNSVTYDTSSEPNGVHLSSNNQDSCIFSWQAPSLSAGDVKLYLGGLQGTSANGQNTSITLTSSQAQGIYDAEINPIAKLLLQIYPSVTSQSIEFNITIPNQGNAQLKILQVDGKVMDKIPIQYSTNVNQRILYNTVDKNGRYLPNGTYIAALICGKNQVVKKFIIRN